MFSFDINATFHWIVRTESFYVNRFYLKPTGFIFLQTIII